MHTAVTHVLKVLECHVLYAIEIHMKLHHSNTVVIRVLIALCNVQSRRKSLKLSGELIMSRYLAD